MAKKQHNPFKDCGSINEFFEVLRAELTKLRGKPFKRWKTSQVFVRNSTQGIGHEVSFYLDADYTKNRRGYAHQEVSWRALAVGDRPDLFDPRTKLGKGVGVGVPLGGGGGGSGLYPWSGNYHGSIHLKYLPKVRALMKKNERIDHLRTKVQSIPLSFTPEEKQILDRADAIREDRERRREAMLAEFDKDNPKFDVYTGRPFR